MAKKKRAKAQPQNDLIVYTVETEFFELGDGNSTTQRAAFASLDNLGGFLRDLKAGLLHSPLEERPLVQIRIQANLCLDA
ncbi:hypothetical protein [Anatilimnocola floriformis]|uniref:hypothetical protein n=1 Tax=Anatilimnocola floriformis TaxID=2948575 RepID=UPI0020C25542|nr:hypothetical protein [Anatilimnocola floriformis]